jgi:hypothetical protein
MKIVSKLDSSHQHQHNEMMILLEPDLDEASANALLKKNHLYQLTLRQARSLTQLFTADEVS